MRLCNITLDLYVLHFQDITFPVKIKDICKKKSKKCTNISVFGYENREKFPIYVSKNTFERHGDLLLIKKENQPYYALIKVFNTFLYKQTLHRDRKHFCRYY